MTSIAWTSTLPSNWQIVPARAMLRAVRRDPRPEDSTVTAFRDGQVTLRSNRRTDGFTESVKEIGYQGVRRGEIVIHSMDAFAGAIGVSDSDGKMSPVVHIYTTPNDNPHFIVRALSTASRAGYILALAKGIRERSTSFDRPVLKSMALPRPPREEQDAIVAYLDRETQKIDDLISEQRGLIETLRERRRAVIAEASTRGIDRNATFVDSRISWVGLTPSHWRRSRHSAVLHEVKRVVGDGASEATLLSLTKRGIIPRDLSEGKGKFPASFDTYQWVERDQIVFCLFDVDETPRTVGLARESGMVTGAYDVFDVDSSISSPSYLEYYFIGIDDEKRFRPLYTGLRKVIQKPRFKVAPIMLPPLPEQEAIAAYLDEQTSRIDELISESEDLIALSQERRAALITAAVTGQIDVRTAA